MRTIIYLNVLLVIFFTNSLCLADIIFQDDFEYGRELVFSGSDAGRWDYARSGNGINRVTATNPNTGTYSHENYWFKKEEGQSDGDLMTQKSFSRINELYCRFYVYLSDPFISTANGKKMLYFYADGTNTHVVLNFMPRVANSDNIFHNAEDIPNNHTWNIFVYNVHTYLSGETNRYYNDQYSAYFGQNVTSDGTIVPYGVGINHEDKILLVGGTWYCIEVYVKRHLIDGQMKIWVDGQLYGDWRKETIGCETFDTGDPDTMKFHTVQIDGYFNGGSPVEQYSWIDDFVLSTEYIGPLDYIAKEDVDKDGDIDIDDTNIVKDNILTRSVDEAADVNESGSVDVLDIQQVVNKLDS